jgi:type II secretory pathway component PulF
MAIFIYKARNSQGALVQGDIQAQTHEEAVQKILRDGLVPMDVQGQAVAQRRVLVSFQSSSVSLEDLADFLRRFSDLIQADIALVRALQIVEKRTSRPVLREALKRVLAKVSDGVPLSSAIAAESKVFPSYWPGLINAGELSGQLKEILTRLTSLVEKEIETKARLLSGAIYPLLILMVGIITVCFLLVFVVPKLNEMFNELGQTLPLMTQLLLFVSALLAKIWWIIAIMIFLMAAGIKQLFSTVSGKLACERYLLKLPFWGEFMQTDDMERLARTIGILLESGVETVSALECAVQTLKRETFKVQMKKVVDAVRRGSGLSSAFSSSTVFTEDVINMISVGEESGRGAQGFLQWAQVCDRRLEAMTKIATALIEPALILLIGGVIGFIVMALLLPIFQMSLGGG